MNEPFEFLTQSAALTEAMEKAWDMATNSRHEFFTPEHLLWAISWQTPMIEYMHQSPSLMNTTFDYLTDHMPRVPNGIEYEGPVPSAQFEQLEEMAFSTLLSSSAESIDVPHVINVMLKMPQSMAYEILMAACEGNEADLMSFLLEGYTDWEDDDDVSGIGEYDNNYTQPDPTKEKAEWAQYVTCLNDIVHDHTPLIGREQELERTVLVLCRKEKNNPIYVGEAGVGKTAMAYGLTAMIEEGRVPERLRGAKVYELDLGALMAGTQYRGEFEKRLKGVLNGLAPTGNAILFLDEVHTIMGAGRTEGSTLDASSLMKPYLERGDLRFIGATTYDEYKHVTRSKAIARRFEKIDVAEPTVDECKQILHGLKPAYEKYHGVEYTAEAIDYAVEAAAKYINGRFLPDKAIDLIDDAGAWMQTHPTPGADSQVVDKAQISQVLAKVCNVDTLDTAAVDIERLGSLEERVLAKIYGQDTAVKEVTEAVEMSTAGLTDDNKPLASLLFVGPTGVGKTELARVLAAELQLPLLRFDMSEYAEKHTVAKLIGAPAGYVGYDDGGLLTDAVRKQPHCVLLLDEIEKAHADIYNILLQVMDYAMLTDNRGQKADFRHVILIMTTNAGAQNARQASLGFASTRSRTDSMMKAVKMTFKPEFINRLSAVTTFADMDEAMASRILDKKLAELQAKLTAKGVTLSLKPEARELLMREGFSAEYGGREVERVINSLLKPLLMRAMLYGSLKGGGEANVTVVDNKLALA